MTLDLARIGGQVDGMGRRLLATREARRVQLARAHAWFANVSPDWRQLAEQARTSKTSAAAPREALDASHPLPPIPRSYAVLATDGSSIDPDRHGPAMYAVINVGRVRICYGDTPDALLESTPQLLSEPDELYVEQAGRKVLLGERLLDVRRSVAEMQALGSLADSIAGQGIAQVALADGLLTVWRQDWAGADASELTAQFGAALNHIADLRVPLAAYVSQPHSHWVADLLRVASGCRGGTGLCAARCGQDTCALDGVVDIELYGNLPPGNRSGLFEVVGRDADRYGPRNRSHFFYLTVGAEVVRVEVPAWVADDSQALTCIHAVLWDQTQRGQGYPVALARAHEQAVISGQDRQAFRQLVLEALARQGLPTGLSEKQSSKEVRAV
ncbi:MAG: hypothetical protein QOF51_601 [Chloroflexota bacterium]|nr:hypothetical protein [Chloroflexota bacterium]